MTVSQVCSLCLTTLALQIHATGQEFTPKKLSIADGVDLHYVEHGEGTPIIFVHGLLDDASVWSRQQQEFAKRGFRAIAYSRRHNYPNKNPLRPNHSAALEADDLAAFVRKMELESAHVVGCSYGAYTSLLFALNHPSLTQTVTLIEPPIASWLNDLPAKDRSDGVAQHEKLINQGVVPAQAALKSGNETDAIRSMVDAIGGKGKYDSLPQFVKNKCQRNILELRAFLASTDRYPVVDRKKVRKLKVPTLILSGGKSVATARFTDPELVRLIPERFQKRVIFKDATHMLWIEEPVRFREEVVNFILYHSHNE
ncbi:MAG: alpha/beta hydrolase [Pirellulales bacterium]|nr:alpha/beta hydrolase [Pirellulales bacterium]